MDVWLWICDLPSSTEWDESNTPLVYQLASNSGTNNGTTTTQSIQLKASRTSESNAETFITLSIFVQGFHHEYAPRKALWVSNMCPLSSEKPFLPLILQLIQETINRAPTPSHISSPISQYLSHHDPQTLSNVKPVVAASLARILETHTPESFSDFFNLIFLTRLFWLCACDAPSDVGSLYFHSLLAPNLQILSHNKHMPVLKTFLSTVGVDIELRITRSIGYVLVKWLILRDMYGAGLQALITPPGTEDLGVSYANETHGLWVLKGHLPVWSMNCTISAAGDKQRGRLMYPFLHAGESALRYALAHQHLEAIIQFEYNVEFSDTHIIVTARVDNFRFHVVRLGYNGNKNNNNDTKDNVILDEEIYFPSRVQVWIGPEAGSTYVTSLSLGRSTRNVEKEIEMQRVVKGSFGRIKNGSKIKAMDRTSTRVEIKNWKWDQDVDGNTVICDATLCDNVNGFEVYAIKPPSGSGVSGDENFGDGLRRRYTGASRPFLKSGGLIFAKDEYGEEVKWRLDKDMEGGVLKWRIGCKIWLSYWPSNVKSSYYETRCIELCDEVDLPLIPNNKHSSI